MTIKSDIGQHSRFLRCFGYFFVFKIFYFCVLGFYFYLLSCQALGCSAVLKAETWKYLVALVDTFLNNHHLFLRLGGFDIELIAFLIFQISPWILTTILISYSSGSWELLWSLMMWPADPLLSLLLGGHLHRHVVLTWIQTSLTRGTEKKKTCFYPRSRGRLAGRHVAQTCE